VSTQRVVALLGTGVVAADTPILRADDLGALRGDGIFETMHVRSGRAWLLDEHLARMARSAAQMELSLPARADLAGLVEQALAAWPAEVEGAIRVVCTRGQEDAGGTVTVFATVSAVTETSIQARRNGVGVVTASLGVPAELRPTAPWLLGGAKTLSYAVNMASQRWAQSVGADDVLWVSADGYALEGPTSTLVWLDASTLCTVPVVPTGILAGTTARWLLDHADSLGWSTDERMISPAELAHSDGAWLTSSVRGAVHINTLDGTLMPAAPAATESIRDLLGYATASARMS
jgi:4-amino-4-deoxychorismate lyase